MDKQHKNQPPHGGTGPGNSGIENADMDRDMTADAETDKSAEAPGNDPSQPPNARGPLKRERDTDAERG
jgi:hypothetical protein